MFVNLRPRKAAGKENNKKKELVKDKSKKKLTCLRCCQCATCKRRKFSDEKTEYPTQFLLKETDMLHVLSMRNMQAAKILR